MKQLLIDGRTLTLEDVAMVAYDLPAKIKVKLGDRAVGGETVMATFE